MKYSDETTHEARGDEGMTLIEVMVSLTVMGVVLIMLGQGLTLGIRMNTQSKAKISNLSICKQVTEDFKSRLQADQAVFDGASNSASAYYAQFNRPSTNPIYYDADGAPLDANADPKLAAFEVVTSVKDWKDATNNPMTDTSGTVLLKTLDVQVVSRPGAFSQAATGTSRETTMRVEITRPAA